MSIRRFQSENSAATISIGREIASLLSPPKFLILRGDLGAGKTTLVKGIASAIDAADPDEVTSPTFTLIHEYQGSLRAGGGGDRPVDLYHLDLYRIDNERQLQTLGLEELTSENAIVLVEWGEKFPSVLKRSGGEISIEHAGGDSRTITLTLAD
ncbi:MAG TPA: tRNA (adenosine(37)-N6)-threonylcarbamoyltransferase complex ATPase subunit type 1 TsaE [Acidobacteriaceae bacterium]|nr:tRNA (adenosine(37)-N6)-threonylcarbamoyltransferase complex ATPase subunit type 1 TsaE [Acidobacteriaceae bacterium]